MLWNRNNQKLLVPRYVEDKSIVTWANVIRLLLLFEKIKTDVSKETLQLGV